MCPLSEPETTKNQQKILLVYDIKTTLQNYNKLKRKFYYHLAKLDKEHQFLSKSVILVEESALQSYLSVFNKIGAENIDFFVVYYTTIIPKHKLFE